MKRNTRLKFEDRVKIETLLCEDIPVSIICKKLNVSKQTIYREIERNSIYKKASTYGGLQCIYLNNCPYSKPIRSWCNNTCTHFIQEECKKVTRFPFICNKCQNKAKCRLEKRYYYVKAAQSKAEESLHKSRLGIRISQEDFEQINNIISPLVQEKRQSLNHILTTHSEIDVSERTLRNWINKGYTDAKTIDLPRTVSFKPKKEYIHRITKPASVIDGRSYRNYRSFCKEHPDLLISQFDTIVGKTSDLKRILTIHFPSIHFQFGILLEENSAKEVNSKLRELQEKIGIELWKKIFPVLLTDNGFEFNEFFLLEIDVSTGEVLSHVFYCNPYCAAQKGACERNHELFRYIEPKYHSLDHLNQDKVNLIFSHINSLFRPSLGGIRPVDLAEVVLGKDFLEIVGIKKIEPDNVNLTQSLTKIRKH